jgi:hypothetical protein
VIREFVQNTANVVRAAVEEVFAKRKFISVRVSKHWKIGLAVEIERLRDICADVASRISNTCTCRSKTKHDVASDITENALSAEGDCAETFRGWAARQGNAFHSSFGLRVVIHGESQTREPQVEL